MKTSPIRTPLLAISMLGLSISLGSASIIVGGSTTVTDMVDDDFNLTALGVSDWVIWNSTSTGTGAATPNNSMSGGTLISDLTAVGGGAVRGTNSGNNTSADFSFTNGTPTASATINNAVGAFNTDIGTIARGVSFTVALPTTDAYTVYVWGGGFEAAIGTFTASLTGATSYVDTALSADSGSPKDTRLYTLTVTPDNPGDLLNVQLMLTGETTNSVNSHVLFGGAALGVVPEPASLLLLVGGATALVLRRNRKVLVS